jgi:trk system potassium uptake protein TrkH
MAHQRWISGRWFRVLCALSAAEATVLSFLFASVVGGIALYATEHRRTVETFVPVLEEVHVTPVHITGGDVLDAPRTEVHTYLMSVRYRGEHFVDALFTAVSALCVTGLTSSDFSSYTLPGQIIVMLLIQIGGLGIIFCSTVFAILIVRGLTEHENFRDLLAGVLDTDVLKVRHMIRNIIMYTVVFEGFGFLVMGAHLSANPDVLRGLNPWWWALFHSISAFNNAGFGLMSNNLMSFAGNPVINSTIAMLIVAGGMGYPVIIAVHTALRRRILGRDRIQEGMEKDVQGVVASPVQTRVAIVGTLLLLLAGTVLVLPLEWHNPVLASFSPTERVMAAFFQSVSTRTAGFNTVDIGALTTATLFLYMILMFIGANPAGTAGGVKIPTMAVLYAYVKDWFDAPGKPLTLFGNVISKFALSHAIRLTFFASLFIGSITFIICAIERTYLITPDPLFHFTKILFEIISAFGTVGLSMGFSGGVTSFSAILHPSSKVLIMLTMLFGRLGPLTVLAALPWKRTHAAAPLSGDVEGAQKMQIG